TADHEEELDAKLQRARPEIDDRLPLHIRQSSRQSRMRDMKTEDEQHANTTKAVHAVIEAGLTDRILHDSTLVGARRIEAAGVHVWNRSPRNERSTPHPAPANASSTST